MTKNRPPRIGQKELREIVAVARHAGWTVNVGRSGGHVKFFTPAGQLAVVANGSKSRPEEITRTRQRLRKAGLTFTESRDS